jgi:hypothetical protein
LEVGSPKTEVGSKKKKVEFWIKEEERLMIEIISCSETSYFGLLTSVFVLKIK